MGGLTHRDNRREGVITADVIGLARPGEQDLIPTEDGVRAAVPTQNPAQREKMRRQTRAGIPSGVRVAVEAVLAGSAMETDRFSPANPVALEMNRVMRPVIPRHPGEMPRQRAILVIVPATKRPEQPGNQVPLGPG